MRYISVLFFLVIYSWILGGQNYGDLQKEEFGKDLYKVKSGNYYGIFDRNDNVIVSVEYENILLSSDGLAVLRKNNGCVYGSVNENGEVSLFEKVYKYHPNYPFYAEGHLPVKSVKDASKDKWFFVDQNGVQMKKNVSGFLLPLIFRSVMPFSEGYAAVINTKGEHLHIDKNGKARFVIEDEEVLFRTSVNNGESVIITSAGVKIYQEDKVSLKANVKRVLSPSCKYNVVNTNLVDSVLELEDGDLYLDYLGRASKYIPKRGDPIIWGAKEEVKVEEESQIAPLPIAPQPVVFDLKDISVGLKQTVVSASSKGWAGIIVQIKNNSQVSSGILTVIVSSPGIKPKESVLEIPSADTQSISVSLPAQFSDTQKNQEVIVEVSDGNHYIEEKLNVILKRYEASSIL